MTFCLFKLLMAQRRCSVPVQRRLSCDYALNRWPAAHFIGKTEDDAYVNLRTLEMEVRALHASRGIGTRVMYGAFDICAMPNAPRESRTAKSIATPKSRTDLLAGGLGGSKA